MKYIKIFEDFNDIDSICRKYNITNYTINSDGSIDVDGDVDLSDKGLTKLPLKFREVGGNFYCHDGGVIIDRDENSAINMKLLGSSSLLNYKLVSHLEK